MRSRQQPLSLPLWLCALSTLCLHPRLCLRLCLYLCLLLRLCLIMLLLLLRSPVDHRLPRLAKTFADQTRVEVEALFAALHEVRQRLMARRTRTHMHARPHCSAARGAHPYTHLPPLNGWATG